jgi:hypothetical protein
MASIFTNAKEARKDTRNNVVIHGEVRSLESAILANVSAGVLYANISSGTTMTDSNAFYKAFFSITTDAAKVDQINYVKKYFTDLGYGVDIKQNDTQTIVWNISW